MKTLALTLTLSPGERGYLLAVSDFLKTLPANADPGCTKHRRTILPLLGERAGVRVNVNSN